MEAIVPSLRERLASLVEAATEKATEDMLVHLESEMTKAAVNGRWSVKLQTAISYERLTARFPDIGIKEEAGWAPHANRAVIFSWAPKK